MKKVKYYLPLIHRGNFNFYPFLRVGGFGLGNILFPYFRSIINAIKDGAVVLYPLTNQVQPRNFMRERSIGSLRNYSNVFSKLNWITIDKYYSSKIFYSRKWFNEDYLKFQDTIVFEGCRNYFYDFIEERELIKSFINYSYSLKPTIYKNRVAFHLRLGDFLINGKFINRKKILNSFLYFTKKKDLKINIYSNSSEKNILSFLKIDKFPDNVSMIKSSSAMKDILDMANSEYICGNPYSTYVEWARFLAPSVNKQISYSLISERQFNGINVSPLNWDNYL